jgi:hypothetical protein
VPASSHINSWDYLSHLGFELWKQRPWKSIAKKLLQILFILKSKTQKLKYPEINLLKEYFKKKKIQPILIFTNS